MECSDALVGLEITVDNSNKKDIYGEKNWTIADNRNILYRSAVRPEHLYTDQILVFCTYEVIKHKQQTIQISECAGPIKLISRGFLSDSPNEKESLKERERKSRVYNPM